MTEPPSRKIVSTGLIALDMILSPKGELVSSALGGSAGNVLAILAELGWSTTPVANLGDDKAARRLIDELIKLHSDVQYVKMLPTNSTPIVYQHLLEGSADKTHSFSFFCPVCGQKRSPSMAHRSDQAADTIVSKTPADVFYLDRATPLAVELAEHYRGIGTLVFFEPSTVGDDRELFCRALRSSHIVKYADERLSDLVNFPLEEVAVEICTMGREGLRFRAPSLTAEWIRLAAFEAPWIVDTSGAGDWCSAGMLFRLFSSPSFDIRNLSYNALSHALRFGQSLSALNCMTLGARGLTNSMSAKKIASTGQHLEDAIAKAQPEKMPDSSWLAYDLRGDRFKSPKPGSGFSHFNSICCSALS
jgi:sugar/nucleoside kinase (ribokinase family)